MMRTMVLVAIASLAAAAPAAAQNEEALKSFFEGHRVTVRIDMPGTQEGVDVYADARRAFDMNAYRSGVRKYGVALRSGESATVTLIKVKKDLIEFQLDGGGYGTFSDDTSTSVNMPLLEKSEREKDLEHRLKDEDDRERRRQIQHELDDLRDRRERENRRITAERERAEAAKAELIADRRLRGGSRFNLRYADRVPAGIRPEEVVAALTEYVDFGTAGFRASQPPLPIAPLPPPADVSQLRKGMTRGDVERLLGSPAESSRRVSGEIAISTFVFLAGDDRVTADFVEDLLVRYTISSR
jgi:hypothetical protein